VGYFLKTVINLIFQLFLFLFWYLNWFATCISKLLSTFVYFVDLRNTTEFDG